MNSEKVSFEELYERVESFSLTTIELAKLESIEKLSEVVAILIWRISIFLILALFSLIFSIGVSIWIGENLNQMYIGFIIVSFVHLLTVLFTYFFALKWIKGPITRQIIKQTI